MSSVEPSSTKMISNERAQDSRTGRSLSSSGRIFSDSLYTGATTDSSVSVVIIIEAASFSSEAARGVGSALVVGILAFASLAFCCRPAFWKEKVE